MSPYVGNVVRHALGVKPAPLPAFDDAKFRKASQEQTDRNWGFMDWVGQEEYGGKPGKIAPNPDFRFARRFG